MINHVGKVYFLTAVISVKNCNSNNPSWKLPALNLYPSVWPLIRVKTYKEKKEIVCVREKNTVSNTVSNKKQEICITTEYYNG